MPVTTLPSISRRRFALSLAAGGAVLLNAQSPSDHWALLSDTHIPADPNFGHRGFRPTDNLAKVVPQVIEASPATALICGDVARLTGESADYAAVAAIMKPVIDKLPVAMALGNHDDRKNFLAALGQSQKTPAALRDRHVLVVEGNAVRVIVLDSLIQPNLTPGLLGKGQRDWLNGYLDGAGAKPCVLCVHHTLDDNDGALLDAPRLFEIIKNRRQVKAVIYGHSHRYNYSTWEGIHLINLPAVGYNFNDKEPIGWVEARLTPKGGAFKLRAVGGNTEANGKTTELDWRS